MSVHVSSNVWRSCPQKHERLLLMLALADFANDDGVCWPSQNSLAKRIRCSERGVVRMIDGLIDEGEIELIHKGGSGRGDHSKYLLARYSEGGLCTTFRKDDPESKKDDLGAIKGGRPPGKSVVEPLNHQRTPSPGEHVVNIYEAYPKKVGRPAALKAIAKALKSNSFDRLHELTLKYAEAVAGSDPQFIPHPATFFNQERYNDDPKTWTRSDKRDRTQSSRNVGTANEGKSSQYRGVGKGRPIHRSEGG